MNDLSIWVLFTTKRKRQLGDLKVDWESNADNFDDENKLVLGRPPNPLSMNLYKTMRVHVTRNVDKGADFNGMEAVVKSYDRASLGWCSHVETF